MNEHLSKQFDADLADLRSRAVAMGGLVEEQVRMAVDALISGREELAQQVVRNDARVNAYEMEIDDNCARIIARRQPAASDLRMILGISKMTTDLERIGDKARKIARLAAAIRQSGVADSVWLADVKRLSDHARAMVRDALGAFVRTELNEAIEVIRAAHAMNRQTSAVAKGLVQRMSENPDQVAVLLDMISVVKAVDRTADHAANLAEHLIYVVRGTDVRHATLDQIEQEALQR
jgi:phosphate transport system protein